MQRRSHGCFKFLRTDRASDTNEADTPNLAALGPKKDLTSPRPVGCFPIRQRKIMLHDDSRANCDGIRLERIGVGTSIELIVDAV